MLNGKFIGVREEANVFVVERKFAVRFAKQLILRATALGVYFAEVNGVRVGDGYLAPGWTTYNKTLQVQEYDITRIRKTAGDCIRKAQFIFPRSGSRNFERDVIGQGVNIADIFSAGRIDGGFYGRSRADFRIFGFITHIILRRCGLLCFVVADFFQFDVIEADSFRSLFQGKNLRPLPKVDCRLRDFPRPGAFADRSSSDVTGYGVKEIFGRFGQKRGVRVSGEIAHGQCIFPRAFGRDCKIDGRIGIIDRLHAGALRSVGILCGIRSGRTPRERSIFRFVANDIFGRGVE